MSFDTIISSLELFGFKPANHPSLMLGILIVLVGSILYTKSNKINNTLSKVKLNIKAISTFLATTHPKNFNPAILESMSPLQIKEGGYEIVRNSGLESIMENLEYRTKILQCVSDQSPKTKLDVETQSIVCFNIISNEDFMNPVKIYLYNKPEEREVFPTLAGVYIRNQYLKDHPEITE